MVIKKKKKRSSYRDSSPSHLHLCQQPLQWLQLRH